MEFDSEQLLYLLTKVSKSRLFNPYTDICQKYDTEESPFIRKNNLLQYLSLIENRKVTSLLIGEAPGYAGCRRTGIPFTCEFTLKNLNRAFRLRIKRATSYETEPFNERSATKVWKTLDKLENPPFLWNIIPFHPHPIDDQLSNRTPSAEDYKVSRKVTEYFLESTRDVFDRIFAIGNVSLKYLTRLGYDCEYIRHPSYGGGPKFVEGISLNFAQKTVSNRLEVFF